MPALRPALKFCLTLAALSCLLQASLVPMNGFDTDFWWHLAGGRYMVENHLLLRQDVFSHTRFGEVWANRDWAFQLLLYAAYSLGGLNLAIGLRVICPSVALTLLFLAARRRGATGPAAGLAVFWAGMLAVQYPNVRPFLISLLCGAGMAYGLEGLRNRFNLRDALIVLLSHWYWSNNHGGVSLIGLAMVFVYAVTQPGPQLRAWAALLAGTAVTTVAVPQPLETMSFVIEMTLGKNPYKHIIVEFFPPNFLAPHELPFALFLLVYLVCALRQARRSPRELLLFLTFSPLIFGAGRHQFLLLPLLAPGLASMLSSRAWPTPPRAAMVGLCILCALLTARQAVWSWRRAWPPERLVYWEELPEGACRWLKAHNLKGKLFNDMPWGGYLLWRLTPDLKVFMDARNEVYPAGPVLRDFLDLLLVRRGQAHSLALLDQYGVDIIVLNSESTALSRLVAAGPGWRRDYDDGVACVYLRSDRPSPGPPPAPFWTDRWHSGLKALAEGRREEGLAQLTAALSENPDCARLRFQTGALLADKDPQQAERQLRRSVLFDSMTGVHYTLGLLAERRGNFREAACEFQSELALGDHPEARARLARLAPVPWWYWRARAGWRRFWAPFTD